jgi:hypothetical protein
MTELVQLIQEADLALVTMEQSRQAVDTAKAAFDFAKVQADEAKAAFDQVVAKADEFGVPRVKLRKLAEERGAALLASGLISIPVNQMRAAKSVRANKRTKAEKAIDGDSTFGEFGTAEETSIELISEAEALRLDA